MADPAGSGIRERKKVRTREALVEAATELCLRQADCLIVVRHGDDDRPTMVPFEIESVQTGAVFHRRRELVLLHEGHDPPPGSTSPA